MAHDVFVSFKNEDMELAEKICDDLATKGIKCWISSRGIRGGQNYQEEIVKALKNAAIMVLVFSAAADKSDEIKKELGLASKYKKHVIPVRIEDFSPGEKYEYEMTTRQYLDLFRNWEKEIDRLAADIKFMMTNAAGGGQQKSVTSLPVGEATNDNKYLDMLTVAYADGEMSSSERDLLNRKANELCITADRAKELEEQIKRERMPIQGATQVLPNETSQTAVSPDESHVECNATKEISAWPDAGITFLMNFKRKFDPADLPFKPVEFSSDAEIAEELEIAWFIDDIYYFSVWLTSKRMDKVDLRWGYYSTFEKRDPLFRQRCDAFDKNEKWLNDDEDVVIDGDIYYFNSEEGYLGFETSQRKTISSLSDPALVEVIANKMKVFSQSIWPIIVANSGK